ncbi:MAG: TetR/AcrR family transcriptional regulator [Clostridia bacterium]|nr:TetR/AcrR family transcriptional regulator [Clostridia bacterium]
MPPKPRFTKEEMIETAFQAVKTYGEEILSTRNLSHALGCSTAPLFTHFSGIEEIRTEVILRAKALYGEYIQQGLSQPLPFKGAGLSYIRFAKEEPHLFRMLFMREGANEHPTHYFPQDEHAERIANLVQNRYGLSEERAKALYNHLSVYAHGLATMFAQGGPAFTLEDASQMLSEVFTALLKE